MGEYTTTGYLSGRPYQFNISGDTPSETEMARMQAILEREEPLWAEQFQQQTGMGIAYDDQPGTAIGRGIARGIPGIQSALGTAAEYTGFEGIGDYLQGAAQERQLDLLAQGPGAYGGADWRDVRGLSSGASYLGELIGEQLPLIGGTVAAGGAAFAAGASAPVAAAIGTAAASGPTLFGSNLQRQERQVAAGELGAVDVGDAALAAIGQTALEAASNVLLPGLGVTRGAGAALAAIPAEALTEIGQQALEQQQAGLPVDSEDAYREYLDAGIAGGALGGVFGASGLALERFREQAPQRDDEPPAESSDQQFDDVPSPARTSAQVSMSDLDPEGPITDSTLDTLGLPPQSGVRRALASGTAEDQILDRLEQIANDNQSRAEDAELGAAQLAYIAERRAALAREVAAAAQPDIGDVRPNAPRREPTPREPMMSEEEAFTAAADDTALPTATVPEQEVSDIPFTEEEMSAAAREDVRKTAPGEVPFGVEPDAEQTVEDMDKAGEVGATPEVEPEAEVAPRETETEVEAEPQAEPVTRETAPQPEAAPREEVAEVPREPMSGAIPGQETGAAGQVIPAPVAPWQGPLRPQQRAVEAAKTAVPGNDLMRLADRASNESVTAEINAWQANNLSPTLYEYSRTSQETTARGRPVLTEDLTTSRDKNRVLELIRSDIRNKKEKTSSNPRYAAQGYFRKAPTTTDAIDEIAYDAAAAPYKQFDPRGVDDKGEREYFARTGITWGKSAVTWVRESLGPEANAYLDAQLQDYTEFKTRTLQRHITDTRVKQDTRQIKKGQKLREAIEEQTQDYAARTDDTQSIRAAVRNAGRKPTLSAAPWEDIAPRFSEIGLAMHPRALRALRAGDLPGAIRAVISTSPDPEVRKLAKKLAPFVQENNVYVLPGADMQVIRDAFIEDSNQNLDGAYIARYSDEDIAEYETREPERAQFRREYNGAILINGDGTLSVQTLLHEMIHAATEAAVRNPSHPLAKQLEALFGRVEAALPEYPEAFNLRELLAEVFTNNDARQRLAQVAVVQGGEQGTLLARIQHAIANFVRTLMGKPRQEFTNFHNVRDAFDATLDDLLAPDTALGNSGVLLSEAMSPRLIPGAFSRLKNKIVEATPENMERLAQQVRDASVPTSVKEATVKALMPMQYVVEAASKYMPSAPQMRDLVRLHNARGQALRNKVNETARDIGELLKTPEEAKEVSRLIFDATSAREGKGIDPRDTRGTYTQYTVQYTLIDPTSGKVTQVVRGYPTADRRNADYDRLQANPPANMAGKVRRANPDQEIVDAFNALQRRYNALSSQQKEAVGRAFAMPEYLREQLQRAIRERLDAMSDGQRSQAERTFKLVFEKLFADQLITPYVALQRPGDFGLSFQAVDPESGALEGYKVAFKSESARREAIRFLEGLGPEHKARIIQSYDLRKGSVPKQGVSPQFISALLSRIDASGTLGSANLSEEVQALVLDMAPETSFMNYLKRRQGTRGFSGDETVFGNEIQSAQDLVNNLTTSGNRLASRIADLQFRPKLDAMQAQLDQEYVEYTSREPEPGQDNVDKANDNAMAASYNGIMKQYAAAPFRSLGSVARKSIAGTYLLTLGFNVSTALLSFMSIPTIIIPYLAGRYGMGVTAAALGAGSRILHQTGGNRYYEAISATGGVESGERRAAPIDFSVSNLDFSKPKNRFLEALFREGERGAVFTRSNVNEELSATSARGWLERAGVWGGLMQHHMERYVRESAMISTYLMEAYTLSGQKDAMSFKQFVRKFQQNPDSVLDQELQAQAAQTAVYEADKMNGPILAAEGQAYSHSDIGRVVYLFKKYGLSMMNLMFQTLKRSLPRNADPQDRRIAQMQFGGILGSVALLSGAQGLPFFHAVNALWNMIFNDEDDEDLETLIRTGPLGEVGFSGLMNYITGMNMSERIGLSGIFYRPSFNADNQTALATILETFGGPVVGMVNKYLNQRPFELMSQGEYGRAFEAVAPAAMANPLRAIRYGTQGVQTSRRDPILDDISPLELAGQFFGFQPADYGRQLAMNSQLRGVDNRLNRRVSALLQRRYVAYRMGDADALREVMEEIREFNREYPRSAITAETLASSLSSHQRTTERMQSGITYSRRNEATLLALREAWG